MEIQHEYSRRLRQIRQQQNLTLKEVEQRSDGVWKAVVVGSYERGTRTLSILRAQELCRFYGVPLSSLFTEAKDEKQVLSLGQECWRFDFRKIRQSTSHSDDFTDHVFCFLQSLAFRRQDWNGEIVSIRNSDLDLLSLLTSKSNTEVVTALCNRSFLLNR